MEALIVYGFVTIVVLGMIGASWRRGAHTRGFRAAAEARGLTDIVEPPSLGLGDATARFGDLHVRFGTLVGEGTTLTRRLSVGGPAPLLPGLALRAEKWGEGRGTGMGGLELEVGDPRFDRFFFVSGSAGRVLAMLGHETRHTLLDLHVQLDPRARLNVAHGEIRADIHQAAEPRIPSSVDVALDLLLKTAPRLPTVVDVPRQLAENVRRDPEPGVRLSNLVALVSEYASHPVTRPTLQEARGDASPEVRLQAALALGPEGQATLSELVDDDRASDECVTRALERLGSAVTLDRLKTVLERALRARRTSTARFCLFALAAHGAPAVETLARAMDSERDEISTLAAAALGAAHTNAAEPYLVRALERSPAELRLIAARALGAVGEVSAVLPLKEAAERLRDRDFDQAARQAIAEIQERASGAAPGQLSVATGEAGHVSFADTEAGGVSMTPDEPGD
jgi:hypothetical protein